MKRRSGLTMRGCTGAAIAGAIAIAGAAIPAQAWEPTKQVTFIIPAGTGGGADQMARFIQGVVTKHNLMKQPMVVINKAGGAGAEGFLEVKKNKGDPHQIIITLSNLFTTPLATGVPFNWKDLTPVAMLALDQFVLWVNSETSYKTAKDYIAAISAGADKQFKMGGTGSKQEDQIITVALEKVTGGKHFTYIPYRGGGEVAVQLVGKHVELDGQQSDRGGRAVAGRRAASALHLRRPAQHLHDQGHGRHGMVRHSDLQAIRRGCRLPDAARHLHARRRDEGAGRLLRRSLQEGARDAGLEGVHGEGRLQRHVHVRRRVHEVGRGGGDASPGAHEERRLPGGARSSPRRGSTELRLAAVCGSGRDGRWWIWEKGMHDQDNAPEEASLASNRVLEIVVALALLTVSAIIIYDSIRLGFGWVEGQGPAAGYFPFYIACVLGIASLAILVKAVLGNSDELKESFVSRVAFGRVLTVLLPAIVYVAAIQYIGLYVASALFILIFMIDDRA